MLLFWVKTQRNFSKEGMCTPLKHFKDINI
jgi:hypothetical protein